MLRHNPHECPTLRETYPDGLPDDSSACCLYMLGVGKGIAETADHIAKRIAGAAPCDEPCPGCESFLAVTLYAMLAIDKD